MFCSRHDLTVDGWLDIHWVRRYDTSCLARPATPLGRGWTGSLFMGLEFLEDGTAEYVSPEGFVIGFPDALPRLQQGETVRNDGAFHEIAADGADCLVTSWDPHSGIVSSVRFRHVSARTASRWVAMALVGASGHRVDLEYDGSARLRRARQRLEGRALELDYDADGLLRAVSAVGPHTGRLATVRYTYDAHGRLATAADAFGLEDRYEYDADARMVREHLKDGGVFVFEYDARGRCVATTGVEGFDQKRLRYLDAIGWTEVVNSLGEVDRYRWGPAGQVLTHIDALGGTSHTTYDDRGRIVGRTDPTGATSRYGYDDRGNRSLVVDPLDRPLRFEFDDRHRAVRLVDKGGHVWTRRFDAAGRLVEATEPLDRHWAFAYDDDGRLIEATGPDGATRRLAYTSDDRVVDETDSNGTVTRYAHDDLGRVVSIEEPEGLRTEFEYDVAGRVIRERHPGGRVGQYAYDAGGNVTEYYDSEIGWSTSRYGSCGRLLERRDAAGGRLRYRWSTEPRRLLSIRNGKGEVYRFVYDACGRIVEEETFDGRRLRFRYNAAGNCIESTDNAGRRTAFVLDALGREIVRRPAGQGEIAFRYDALGYLAEATSETCRVTFTRDALGRVIEETCDELAIRSRYDRAGNRVDVTTPLSQTLAFVYDPDRRLVAWGLDGRARTTIERSRSGQERTVSTTSGLEIAQQHSDGGWLIRQSVRHRDASGHVRAIVERRYDYGDGGELVAAHDSRTGRTAFRYDSADRLVEVAAPSRLYRYAYDVDDNLTDVVEPGGTTTLSYATGDRLHGADGARYEYDLDGRLIRRVRDRGDRTLETQLEWDTEGRLTTVRTESGDVWTYAYDPFGRRISRVGPEQATRYVWDGDVVLHEIRSGAPPATWVSDPHTFRPFALIEGEAIVDIVCDRVGLPREMVAPDGSVLWAADYDPWGRALVDAGDAFRCPFRFQGQWADAETGLHYNRYRYYDPATARYISPDPIRFDGGPNQYAYVANPLRFVDPFGLNTPPSLPDRIVLEGNGVTIVHNYGDMAREHADPIHFHVDQPNGRATRVKADGTVMPGDPPLSKQAEDLLKEPGAKSRLRRAEDRVTRVIRHTKAKPGGRPFKPGNRGLPKGCAP